MPRPRIKRIIERMPLCICFESTDKQNGKQNLTIDELEAMRLYDVEGLEQVDVAKKMNISQPTTHRLLLSARKKVSTFLCQGGKLTIEGGNYRLME